MSVSDLRSEARELMEKLTGIGRQGRPKPPSRWLEHVDPDQLVYVWTHAQSHWRKYPKPGQLWTPADDHTFYCVECLWPKRWLIDQETNEERCWWCDDRRANDEYWREGWAGCEQARDQRQVADGDAGGNAAAAPEPDGDHEARSLGAGS